MVRHRFEDNDRWDDGESAGDDEEEDDDDSDGDFGDDEDDVTIPCPNCRRHIHEDAQRCPYCETYLSEEDTASSVKPWWVVLGAILCLYAMYRSIVGW